MRSSLFALLIFLLNQTNAETSIEIEALAWPALSPDGQTLAFEWLNDIWIAPSVGGAAVRLLETGHREAYPKFSPNGDRLYFSSEENGFGQLKSIGLNGEGLERLTNHTEGNILEAISPDGKLAISRTLRGAAGYKPFRLLKTNLEKTSREVELFGATGHSVSISPDGGKYLFCRGGEQLYRRGYRGSRASEIFLYDEASGEFKALVSEEWEARSPLWMADGGGFYYVSNRNGTFNLWQRRFDSENDVQLTFFEEEAVVLPVISGNGEVIVFRAGQKVFRFEPASGEGPVEIYFTTKEKVRVSVVKKLRVSGTNSLTFDDTGRVIVFSAGGELWLMEQGDESPARLTESDGIDELEPHFLRDGKTLFFLKDDGLRVSIWRATVDLKERKITRETMVSDEGGSKKSFRISPDGKWLSWLAATGNLVTVPTVGGEARVVMKNWDMPTYDWSPKGDWLVVAAKDVHSNRDLWLVRADGDGAPINLTQHPAFEGSPKWSPDGKKIVFVARRELDEIARFWIAEVGDQLENGEFGEILLRRIDTEISEPTRIVWAVDSKSVLFQSRNMDDKMVYSLSVKSGKVSEIADFRGIPLRDVRKDFSLWRIKRVPSVLRGGELERFEFSFSVEQKREARLRLGFRRIWRTLSERFYDETMNGTDWDAVLEKYEDAAAGAFESRQFDRVVAQLLGELNASHLTFKTTPWGLKTKAAKIKNPTAHPGLEFENGWEGELVVKSVIFGAPVSRVKNPPKAGEVVLRIGGKAVNSSTVLTDFLNGAEGRAIPLLLRGLDGEERAVEMIPISYQRVRQLLGYEKEAAAEMKAEAKGLRYLKFGRMKSADLNDLEVEVYRASMEAKGLILDLRNNTGGRVADELLALFCQPVHTFTVPRGGPRGYPTDRRVSSSWDGPMAVLCNENTFSNAEIFCHAFKQLRRGELVGMPTNGGVISAVEIRIPEMGELQIPFRGWFHAKTGRDLELNGAVPDVIVPLGPEDEVQAHDPQLDAALGILEKEISKLQPKLKARFKFETVPEDGD